MNEIAKKINNTLILNILLISILIYNSGYALVTAEKNYAVYTLLFGLILLFPYILKINFIDKKVNTHFLFFIILIVAIIFALLSNFQVDSQTINSYAGMILLIFFSFIITCSFKFKDFLDIFIRIMVIITAISLIFYFILNFTTLNFNENIFINVNGAKYQNFYVYFSMLKSPERNTGIFWEPGLFGSFIIFAIMLEIVFKKKIKFLNILILFIGLLTTQSTASYLLIIPMIILLINKKVKNKNKVFLILILALMFLVSIIYKDNILYLLYSWNPDMFSKLYDEVGATTTTRIFSPFLNFQIFIKNPIFGVGFKNATRLYNELLMQNYGIVDAQTSTTMYMIASLGVFGLFYTVFIFIGIFKNNQIDLLTKIIMTIVILLIINKEPHSQIVFTWCLIFYLLKINYNEPEEDLIIDQKELII